MKSVFPHVAPDGRLGSNNVRKQQWSLEVPVALLFRKVFISGVLLAAPFRCQKKRTKKKSANYAIRTQPPGTRNPKWQKDSHRSLSERVDAAGNSGSWRFSVIAIFHFRRHVVKACLILTMSARLARPLNKWPVYESLATLSLAIRAGLLRKCPLFQNIFQSIIPQVYSTFPQRFFVLPFNILNSSQSF